MYEMKEHKILGTGANQPLSLIFLANLVYSVSINTPLKITFSDWYYR